jgi:hypothetical protein
VCCDGLLRSLVGQDHKAALLDGGLRQQHA